MSCSSSMRSRLYQQDAPSSSAIRATSLSAIFWAKPGQCSRQQTCLARSTKCSASPSNSCHPDGHCPIREAPSTSSAAAQPASKLWMPRRAVLGAAALLSLPNTPLGRHVARASEGGDRGGTSGAGAPQTPTLPAQTQEPSRIIRKRPPRTPVQRVPRAKLPGGLNISKVIKGCWQLDGAHRGDPRTNRTLGADAVADFERFYSAGVTTIDTADIYGPAETLVGQFLRLNPEIQDKVQILTKVTFMEEDMSKLSKEMLLYRVRMSMRRMGVNYIDLLQLHWEDFGIRGYLDAAKWMAELQEDGLIGHIGLTNFSTQHLIEVLDAGVKIVSNQVQYSVIDRRPELYMTDLCERKGIAIIPYGVLAGGFLSDRYLDKPAREAQLDTLSKAKYGTQLKEQGGWAFMQEVLQALRGVAAKHNVSISAVALKWVLQQPVVPAALVGARNARHLIDLRQALSSEWELDEEDMLAIEAVYEGATAQPTTDVFVWERGGAW